ncbi:hypothetical protein DMH03_10985 [Amycolatopsis sp. WAC 01376]|uniref:hypothetical protein n=1 Tax=Amycolatopsis sp. WAC 01376 TaxID=2203195 RepID=UPI000F79A8A1|nr:hypothetical protein [Amycolatopsis sp. WAC 01376]RSM62597.1 hypothetical protein DMH03_10985 [Amycolatopsis sp. WAC 01376]
MTSPAPSPLAHALARTDFAENWYRWCDAKRDWAAEATDTYEEDSLLTASGAYAALPVSEFIQAYRAAGAEVSRGSRVPDARHRSFTVEVAAGPAVCSLAVQLGRGLNSQECGLVVLVDGEQQGRPEMLHTMALAIRRFRGEPDPNPPYPRPIIGSRSQLEVVSRGIVDVLGQVARGWSS